MRRSGKPLELSKGTGRPHGARWDAELMACEVATAGKMRWKNGNPGKFREIPAVSGEIHPGAGRPW